VQGIYRHHVRNVYLNMHTSFQFCFIVKISQLSQRYNESSVIAEINSWILSFDSTMQNGTFV